MRHETEVTKLGINNRSFFTGYGIWMVLSYYGNAEAAQRQCNTKYGVQGVHHAYSDTNAQRYSLS